IDILVNCLDTRGPLLRLKAIVALGKIGDDSAVPHLVPMYGLNEFSSQGYLNLSEAVIAALKNIGGDTAIRGLCQIGEVDQYKRRDEITQALITMGERVGEILAADIASGKDDFFRIDWGLLGVSGRGSLVECLPSATLRGSLRIIEILARFRDEPVVRIALLKGLEHKERGVRLASAKALHKV